MILNFEEQQALIMKPYNHQNMTLWCSSATAQKILPAVWSYLSKKFLMENFSYCAVNVLPYFISVCTS